MIAYAPAGTARTITDAIVSTAMGRHPDGFGIAWRDTSGGQPVLRTATYAPSDKPAFRAMLDAVRQSGDEFAVHFRMATSGPKVAEQSHPFTYEDPDPAVGTVAVMHNGIIGIAHDRAVESDTSAFVRLVLAQLPTQWWTQPALVYLVREAIGYSKLTIMTAAHGTHIVGEELGTWDGGVWFSSEHKPYTPSKWVPASKPTVVSKPAPKPQQAPNPMSKRQRKRAAAAARREAQKAARSSLITADALPSLRHAGHAVTALATMPLDIDADYQGAVICDECRTSGDVYVIDGSRYIDLAHFGPGDGVAVTMHGVLDALGF